MGNLRVAAMALAVVGAWLMVGHGAAVGVDEPDPSPSPACESDCEAAPDPDIDTAEAGDPLDEGSVAGSGGDDSTTAATPGSSPIGTATDEAIASQKSSATTMTAVSARPPARADAAVAIVDNAYEPPNVTVTEGDSVTWTHQGAAPHTVTADDGSFDSGNMSSGDTFSHTFQSAGTFPYFCEVHGQSMSGSVTVEAAAGEAEEEDTGGGGDAGSTDETAPADIADQGLPATGRSSGPWVGIGLVLIALGAVAWRMGRRPGGADA